MSYPKVYWIIEKFNKKKNKALKDEILKFWQTNQPTDQLTNQTAS